MNNQVLHHTTIHLYSFKLIHPAASLAEVVALYEQGQVDYSDLSSKPANMSTQAAKDAIRIIASRRNRK